jgi:hypothetical protein
MLSLIMSFYYQGQQALTHQGAFKNLVTLPVREEISRLKMVPEDQIDAVADRLERQLAEQINALQPQEVL